MATNPEFADFWAWLPPDDWFRRDVRSCLEHHDLWNCSELVLRSLTSHDLESLQPRISLGSRKRLEVILKQWRRARQSSPTAKVPKSKKKNSLPQMGSLAVRSVEVSSDSDSSAESDDEKSLRKETRTNSVLGHSQSVDIPMLQAQQSFPQLGSIGQVPHTTPATPTNGGQVVASCLNCWQRNKHGYTFNLQPERWKTLMAFLYGLCVSWLSAFVMVIVHDRVPDMEKYPPLPDILLDNIPHIPWAFELCENIGLMLLTVWAGVCFFHKHRFILMRRFFSISGTIFLLRCVTMLITSLSVPGKHLDCSPRPYGDMWQKLYNAYLIWSGAGMTLQGVRTCGDYMFSGHTVSLTLLNFFITEYTTRRVYFLHTFTWICNVFGIFFILAAHEHYSIDVFIAFYISTRLFLYYHTLANNKGSSRIGQRAWFYFPLFYFFEANVDGKVPNVFEWPIRIEDLKSLSQKILSYLPDEKLFMSPKPKESFDAGLRQSSQDGPVPAQANDKKKD